jgi:Flp pilus assembly pilin Flp
VQQPARKGGEANVGDTPSREDRQSAVERGESGQGLIEYALIIFLVAIVVIAILLLLGPQIGAVFSSIYATI